MNSLLINAEDYARKWHKDQRYGDVSYSVHLEEVVAVAKRFIRLLPEGDWENAIAACWLHDSIEDTGHSYNDVKKITNGAVADIVYAVTNELGRDRKERAKRTYPKIAADFRAVFVKACDRVANMRTAEANNHGMFKKYVVELEDFVEGIGAQYLKSYADLWRELGTIAASESTGRPTCPMMFKAEICLYCDHLDSKLGSIECPRHVDTMKDVVTDLSRFPTTHPYDMDISEIRKLKELVARAKRLTSG